MSSAAIVFEERVRIPADIFSLQEFRRWAHSDAFPETGRVSYLAGEVDIDMSPEELTTHNQAKTDVTGDLRVLVRRHRLGNVFSDGAMLVNEAADLSTAPDAMFCSIESYRSARVKYVERREGSQRYIEVTGSPDLVIEVVSRTSVHKDTELLPKLYFAAGVAEYWIIDARREELAFRVLVRGKERYVETEPDTEGYRRSLILGRRFLLIREPSPAGGYWYTLLDRDCPT